MLEAATADGAAPAAAAAAASFAATLAAASADGDYLSHASHVRLLIQREGLRGDTAWGETEAGAASDKAIAAAMWHRVEDSTFPAAAQLFNASAASVRQFCECLEVLTEWEPTLRSQMLERVRWGRRARQ